MCEARSCDQVENGKRRDLRAAGVEGDAARASSRSRGWAAISAPRADSAGRAGAEPPGGGRAGGSGSNADARAGAGERVEVALGEERVIGGHHRVAADGELGGELARRRQPRARPQAAVEDMRPQAVVELAMKGNVVAAVERHHVQRQA